MLKGLKVIAREESITDYILPKKVLACEGNIENIAAILNGRPLQMGTFEADCMRIRGRGYILLDFGKEICGGVRILTFKAKGGCKVRLRFGESVSETCSDARPSTDTFVSIEDGRCSATNDHAFRDFIADLTYLSDLRYGNTGFRFLRIDFISGFDIYIKSIAGAFEHRNLKRIGKFCCSNPLVNEIFETAAYTVELCMQNGMLWDGIKRDRLVWIGDMHPETLSILSLFGADRSIEKSLSFACDNTILPNFMNNMAAYSLWWLCIMADYYIYTGKQTLLQKCSEYITGLVELFDSLLDENGQLHLAEDGSGFFIDWPTFAFTERKAGVYALFAIAMKKTKILYRALGKDSRICDFAGQRLNKNLSGGTFKQINALKVLAGHMSPEDATTGLLEKRSHGMSTFMSYYILSAIAECGRPEAALDILCEYYGGMLQRGATTFWEDFDISWLEGSGRIDSLPMAGEKDIHADFGAYCYKGLRHSLCHGWASGPVSYLFHRVLGLNAVEPGCRKVSFCPSLSGLDWATGVFPTPFGPIEVELKNVKGKTVCDIAAPDGVQIVRKRE